MEAVLCSSHHGCQRWEEEKKGTRVPEHARTCVLLGIPVDLQSLPCPSLCTIISTRPSPLISMLARGLYGGAITTVLPARFADVSNLREVPDHQEVFLDDVTEASLIVELLDMEVSSTGDIAVLEHFRDLARDNESTRSDILTGVAQYPSALAPHLDQSAERIGLVGLQHVKKHRSIQATEDTVIIVMVLLRLANVTTDVLITLNIPVPETLTNDPIVFPQALAALTPALLLPTEGPSEAAAGLFQLFPSLSTLREFVSAFRVVDWGLFGA